MLHSRMFYDFTYFLCLKVFHVHLRRIFVMLLLTCDSLLCHVKSTMETLSRFFFNFNIILFQLCNFHLVHLSVYQSFLLFHTPFTFLSRVTFSSLNIFLLKSSCFKSDIWGLSKSFDVARFFPLLYE